MDNTNIFNVNEIKNEEVKEVLKDVYDALIERHYNPVNQLTGYLMSGDLAYISSHKDARKKIGSISREKILEVLLNSFMEKS